MSDLPNSESPETVGTRLRYWRKISAFRLVDLAALIQVSQGSLSDLENDKSLPSATTLTGLCTKTDINIRWLLTGKGSVTPPKIESERSDSAHEQFMSLMQDREFRKIAVKLMNIYSHADNNQKAQIKGFLTGMENEPF